MQKIFFSYAWEDHAGINKDSEMLVNSIYDSLKKDGCYLIRDKTDLGYKDFISEFMQSIGQGDKIIIVISDKYVRSPFCMFELYEIARNSKFEKSLFSEHVIPITLEFIEFFRPAVVAKYMGHWEYEQKEWESLFQKKMGQLSIEQFSRYNKTRLISQNIGLLMDWLTDMNMLNQKIVSENNFQVIKEALESVQKFPSYKDDLQNQIGWAKIKFKRTYSFFIGGLVSYDLYMNEKKIGEIRAGGELEVPIKAGLYKLRVSSGFFSEKGDAIEENLSIASNETAIWEISTPFIGDLKLTRI